MKLTLTRRLFLTLAGVAALLALPLTRWLQDGDARQVLQTRLRPQLRLCLDTLLPADAISPAATELGVDDALLAELAELPAGRSQLYLRGLDWCERQAQDRHGRAFTELEETGRDAILQLAAEAPARSMPARFIHRLRDQAFALYYAHPAAMADIAGAGPPQPMGYPHYTEPPA